MISRPWPTLVALTLLTACAQPPATLVTVVASPAPTPSAGAETPAPTPVPDASAASGASAVPSSAPTAAPVVGGGGSAGGGAETPVSSTVFVPAGSGQKSVFVPGLVPSSIELSGSGMTVHLRSDGAVSEPSGGATTLTGSVASGEPDLIVQYVGPGRSVFVGGRTDASGAFSVEVPMRPGAAESGVLIVREANASPRLAIARVTLTDGQAAAVGSLTLAAPLPPPVSDPIPDYHVLGGGESTDHSVPTPGAGLAVTGAALQLAESNAAGPWRATVLTSSAGLPTYDWPGFTAVVSYTAASGDGLRASETSGPAGALPAFLAAPDLSGVASTVGPGSVLSWPAIAGANLYTARLVPVGQEDSPVWEGLLLNPTVTIPAQLSVAAQPLVLELDAWDAPEVTPYAIASLRRLRIPTGPMGATGRHSWARKTVTFTP